MIRDVHSALHQWKQLKFLIKEIELELPELGLSQALQEKEEKFKNLITHFHIQQEKEKIASEVSRL